MKGMDFLRDRIASYGISAAALAVSILFLMAYHVDGQAILIVAVIFTMAALFRELWEFWRKKRYYDRLEKSLDGLDKKYLLPEVVPEPDFYEGKLFCEALRASDKSMCENVAYYRRQSREFREYIELWVHEAKIPVASLLLMCHNYPEAGEKMTVQIKRIDDSIENVLYYARSENAQKDYIVGEVSLRRAFSEVAVKNREILQLKNVGLETEGLEVSVLTDGKWLAFMLGQFLANSLKYFSPERSPRIRVFAEDFSDKTVLHFWDNGIGIQTADLPYIFEKSYTGHNGRGDAKSTGMGLYIAKSLCARLGHDISAASVQGEYTEIMLTFAKNDFYKPK